MSSNNNYIDKVGWYFISSCECDKNAIDVIKARLLEQFGDNYTDIKSGLYLMFFRASVIPNQMWYNRPNTSVECSVENCNNCDDLSEKEQVMNYTRRK